MKTIVNKFRDIENDLEHISHAINMLFKYLEDHSMKVNEFLVSTYSNTKFSILLIVSNFTRIERAKNCFELEEQFPMGSHGEMYSYVRVDERCFDFNHSFHRENTFSIFQSKPFLFAIFNLRENSSWKKTEASLGLTAKSGMVILPMNSADLFISSSKIVNSRVE